MQDKKQLISEALRYGEQLRKEIPQLVQPETSCYYYMALVDEVQRLNKLIKNLKRLLEVN